MAMNSNVDFQDDVIDRLARLETVLTARNEGATDQEIRLRSLERRQWMLAGAASVIGAMLSHVGLPVAWLK